MELHGIGVRFGGLVALEDVTLTATRGHVLGIIGPNGAGKTTLFNVLCGLIAPSSGSMTLDRKPLKPKPHQLTRLGVARTLQGVGLFPGMTALENVMAGATGSAGFLSALLGLPSSARSERVLRESARARLDEFGIAAYEKAYPATLPYAVGKKVALARALVTQPRYLLLDEPAGGLSEEEIAELATLIRTLRGTCTVLLVEHHMDLVMDVCDEVTVLDFGRVIASGAPQEIRDNPAVADAYLGVAA